MERCANEGPDCSAVVEIPDKWIDIEVDRCVMEDLKIIWAAGIHTECCCCGHGDGAAFICVDPSDRERMIEMGYREIPARGRPCADCGVFFVPKYMPGAAARGERNGGITHGG